MVKICPATKAHHAAIEKIDHFLATERIRYYRFCRENACIALKDRIAHDISLEEMSKIIGLLENEGIGYEVDALFNIRVLLG